MQCALQSQKGAEFLQRLGARALRILDGCIVHAVGPQFIWPPSIADIEGLLVSKEVPLAKPKSARKRPNWNKLASSTLDEATATNLIHEAEYCFRHFGFDACSSSGSRLDVCFASQAVKSGLDIANMPHELLEVLLKRSITHNEHVRHAIRCLLTQLHQHGALNH